MKNLLLFAGLFLGCCISKAQNHWLQDGQEWVVEVSGGFGPTLPPINLIVWGDTTINGIPCKIIRVPDAPPNLISNWYAYETNNKVYSYGNYLQEFQKIYDFNAVPGDTITLRRYVGGPLTRYVIDSTGTIDIDGFIRGIQYCKFINNDLAPFHIIEGAGMTRPVNPLTPNPRCAFFFIDYYSCQSFVDGADTKLLCYKDDEISLSFTPDDCEVLLPVNNLAEDHRFQVKIYPNPARDQLNIEFQNAGNGYALNIKDATGKIVFQQEVIGNATPVSTAGWASGMYFVEVFGESNRDSFGYQRFIVMK
ncbi:MAG: T9SS type A sorting domain-containing protein [Saprospiraceae bacterium]